jgi:hypothetical protein
MAAAQAVDLDLLKQFGGSDDPTYVAGSSLFGKGDRVTMADGRPITSLAEKSLDYDLGLPQSGGARRRRRSRRSRGHKRLTRRRRTARGKGRGRSRIAFNLRLSVRNRQHQRS